MKNNNQNNDDDFEDNYIEKLEEENDIQKIEIGNEHEGNSKDQDLNKNSEPVEESDLDKEQLLKRQIRDFNKNLIEGSLYVAGKALSIEELSIELEISKKEVEELINELAFDYLDRSTALIIAQTGDKYQMQIRPEYTEKVSKFAKGGAIAEKYLRTLTVIALKQPILKSLLVKIRGTGAYEHVKYLLDQGLIDAVKKGRTHELTTTEKYAEMFGLPKNREDMKQVMVAQLGLEEVSSRNREIEKE
ncbi:MAG: SMC-Scp complex subunit ScpB [Promethearchaeota archaeon]|nr:MAG: SMC-Scp complex subunit ScpB [Candidatus Lokiarchaeota archaeon]